MSKDKQFLAEAFADVTGKRPSGTLGHHADVKHAASIQFDGKTVATSSAAHKRETDNLLENVPYQEISPFSMYALAKPFSGIRDDMRYTPPAESNCQPKFIQTASGNLVSKSALVFGSNNVHLAGRSVIGPRAIIRGDLAKMRIGKYVIMNPDVVVRPPTITSLHEHKPDTSKIGALDQEAVKRQDAESTTGEVNASDANRASNSDTRKERSEFLPVSVGDFVFIGDGSLIESASIEGYAWIGENCVIGKRSLLMQCCHILPNSTLPPDTVVPPFTAFGGSPAKLIDSLPEATASVFKDALLNCYAECAPHEEQSW